MGSRFFFTFILEHEIKNNNYRVAAVVGHNFIKSEALKSNHLVFPHYTLKFRDSNWIM